MRQLNSETGKTLDELIPEYFSVKEEMDSCKKLCDEMNADIKAKMTDVSSYTTNGYTAKITIQKRESFNEGKLLETLKNIGATDAIKTKEYVDMDVLESLIFNNVIPAENLPKIGDCKEVKEVTVLKVTKAKGE